MNRPLRAVRTALAAFAILSLSLAAAAPAAPPWLIAAPSEAVRGGEALELEAVRPDAATPWPETLRVRLLRADGGEELVVLYGAEAPAAALRRSYGGRLPALAVGVLRAELAELPSNRLALIVAAPASADAIARMSAPADSAGATAAPLPPPRFDPLPEEEPALSANEPMYIVAGARDGLDARFQLSFKYRLFDARSLPARLAPALGHLHVGYTQTSLWDLHGDSKPFRDTSYRPSLFWQGRVGDGNGIAPSFLRGGYEHESNGRDGARSRSIDTLFLQPAWRKDFADGRTLLFAPKFYAYVERDDNPDIGRYRGYADWLLRYGDEAGWVLAARLRRGSSGHGSAQLDLSHPLRDPLFSRVGGFFHVQLFSGYGETLLDYNVKRDPQLRIGFSIVR
ncbi:phospholipase A [Azospira restricta]|uniref:Phospholipase A1 n=1 Tax=Azospira restricta TaxID=404405 RepID=A0A974SMR7_9RHOO|nr:phospholipase A [Azospira restricta]QRJ63311.1 phospholipase A [Azospira restricta]